MTLPVILNSTCRHAAHRPSARTSGLRRPRIALAGAAGDAVNQLLVLPSEDGGVGARGRVATVRRHAGAAAGLAPGASEAQTRRAAGPPRA